MDWLTGIQNAINYIEEHLTEEIDYEEVAKEAACSNFYFQRIFGILCGISLGDYIRNRRLTLAGDELSASDDKVIDVALKYGYESPESFTRAFSRFHGVTPSEAKRDGSKLKSFSRISVKITLSGGSVMNYKIVEKEAFDKGEDFDFTFRMAAALHTIILSKGMTADNMNPGWDTEDAIEHASNAEWGYSCCNIPEITTTMRHGAVFFSNNRNLTLMNTDVRRIVAMIKPFSDAKNLKIATALYTAIVLSRRHGSI